MRLIGFFKKLMGSGTDKPSKQETAVKTPEKSGGDKGSGPRKHPRDRHQDQRQRNARNQHAKSDHGKSDHAKAEQTENAPRFEKHPNR